MGNQLIIVGITGLARSGKDTIAGILCQRFGFTRIALADGVRSAYRDLDGPTWELTKELEKANCTTRTALQAIGTEARLDVADFAEEGAARLFWVYLLMTKAMYLHRHHPERRHRFVIPDMRFPYEQTALATITRNGGGIFQTWKAHRKGAGLSGDAGLHSSETQVQAITPDVTIYNHSSLAELETVVSQYARQLLEPSHGNLGD